MKRILIRTLVSIAIILLALAAGVSGWVYWRAHACLPQLNGSLIPRLAPGATIFLP